MIPDIIHYCWFGNPPKNYMAEKCVRSFDLLKREIEIKEWNEQNTNLSSPKFVAQAFKKKAWAFVSDYVRLKALYDYGGVYLDTDIEIKREFDDSFWEADLVLGYMYDDAISTAVIMSKPHHPFIKRLLDCYEKMELNINIPNNVLMTQQVLEYYPHFKLNGKFQKFDDRCFIYPKTYFEEPVLFSKKGGFSVHHFMGSWHPKKKSLKVRLRSLVKYLLFYCFIINWIYQKANRKIYLKRFCFYKRYLNDKNIN